MGWMYPVTGQREEASEWVLEVPMLLASLKRILWR